MPQPETYSTYEAKSRFSEIIRKVRSGKRVVIAYRGERVAEIRPVEPPARALAARRQELRRAGILAPSASARASLKPLARRTGALKRFLEDRNG